MLSVRTIFGSKRRRQHSAARQSPGKGRILAIFEVFFARTARRKRHGPAADAPLQKHHRAVVAQQHREQSGFVNHNSHFRGIARDKHLCFGRQGWRHYRKPPLGRCQQFLRGIALERAVEVTDKDGPAIAPSRISRAVARQRGHGAVYARSKFAARFFVVTNKPQAQRGLASVRRTQTETP